MMKQTFKKDTRRRSLIAQYAKADHEAEDIDHPLFKFYLVKKNHGEFQIVSP
jgi:hypothetical protein